MWLHQARRYHEAVGVLTSPGAAAPPDGDATDGDNGNTVRHKRNVMVAAMAASVLVAVAFVGYAVVVSRQPPTSKFSNLVLYSKPSRTPSFTLATLGSGPPISSSVLSGGPAVVNWFQSTCVACQAEIGAFASVANGAQKKVHVLGIDLDDPSPANALTMVHEAKADYPVAEAPGIGSISLATRFGVGDLPATVFVSSKGDILGEVLGKIPRTELLRLVDNLAAGRPLNS